MKFTAVLPATMVSLPMLAQASLFGFDTFSDTSCNGFQEFIQITQQGANSNNFPGPRASFQVIDTDNDCELIVWTGENFTGSRFTFDKGTLPVGTCFGVESGVSFLSFDCHCF